MSGSCKWADVGETKQHNNKKRRKGRRGRRKEKSMKGGERWGGEEGRRGEGKPSSQI